MSPFDNYEQMYSETEDALDIYVRSSHGKNMIDVKSIKRATKLFTLNCFC